MRSRYRAMLGPLCLEICSNEPEVPGVRQLPQVAPPGVTPDYTVNLYNLDLDGPWPDPATLRRQERSYRSGRFAAGYYLTDHFGAPAYLKTFGNQQWIFARNFEPILWPYVVKYLLTVYSLQHELLHLKAASLEIEGRGTLLVARGGGGKTLLLAQLCRAGARFSSNTHTLLDRGTVIPVTTAVRVRDDALFGPLIKTGRLPPAIKSGEFTADPVADLGWAAADPSPARHICLVDYRAGQRVIRELERSVALEYMDQFSLALNVYGLKEDVLEFLGCDVRTFAAHVGTMRNRLARLVDRCDLHYISCDSMDPENVRAIYAMLAT